ncbi:unnamed protein product [Closterium sp. Yama58-4]|nr:unnamed protein product [Closterium sp. Yama58-4]
MVGGGDDSVGDTLEARLENARRRHEAKEFGDLPWAVVEAGIRAGGVDVGVHAGSDQVGSNAEGTSSRQRGLIHSGEVGGVQARGMQSSAAAGTLQDLGHPPAGWSPDILTWKEAIEPEVEMARLMDFAAGTMATPSMDYPDPRAEFRVVQLLTFTVILRYNLPKRLSVAPSTRATLNEDTLTSHQDEAMQEAELPSELLPLVNNTVLVKQGGQSGQRRQSSGSGSSGDDSDDDDAKGGRGRSASRCPRRGGNQPHKEKQSTKSSTSAKDADSFAGGKGRDDKEASCSLVGVVEPTVSLAPEAGEDFQAVAAAVQANPAVVLLDSGCSHHLMGTKNVFVDLDRSGDVKHVRGFNRAP